MRVSYWLHEIFASLIPRPTTATLPLLPRLVFDPVGAVFLAAVGTREHGLSSPRNNGTGGDPR